MTIFDIFVLLILGVIMLVVGIIVKKKWLRILSIIPLAISVFQLVLLIGMGK
ncbi:hypothetical protein J2T56_002056 [Natronobacillus azotifigens]|uniref:Uncharacterized protein n=1 Tax=Natronobacillus azotifigens TaxID=472978 RepID=A0A9J6RER4_9BACI|nr:hypothetical protein [Natronobacillus azotifigens]MCZ0703835.1 hypothetical protein [Natronobacillus azotifigens]